MALRVWLPLNGNLNNYGLSDIDFTLASGGNFTLSNDGKIGKCYYRNYLKHLTEDFLGNTWTVAFWVKNTDAWVTYNDILFCKNTDSSEDCLMYISIVNGAIFNAAVNAGSTGATYSYTFSTNTWYHIAVSYNGLQICMYINGVLVKTQERISEQSKGHLNLGIGCRSINSIGTNLTGGSGYKYFNDVRIYDHCLSPKEVYELSKGLIVHYKLDGNDIGNGGLIPNGVELYDYILSNGTLWINTEYIPKGNFGTEIKFQLTQTSSFSTIWGSMPSSSLITPRTGFHNYPLSLWMAGINATSSFGTANTNIHTLKLTFSNGTETMILDGSQVYTGSPGATALSSNNLSIGLFARNLNPVTNYTSMKCYYFSINDGSKLVRNLIPCTYLGESGMWDTVENKFYRNQGTGLFTLGNKITLKEYEYLLSSGTLYINTKVTNFDVGDFDIKYKFKFDTWNSEWDTILGTHGYNVIFRRNSTTTNMLYYVNSSAIIEEHSIATNTIYNTLVSMINNMVSINVNGNIYEGAASRTPANNYPLFIYASNVSGTAYHFSKSSLYYLQISKNNRLVRDFVPVSYNGTPGLLDKIEWKFYANAGSGSFTLGPEVTVQQDDCSGYQNNGAITGEFSILSDSKRYSSSIKYLNSDTSIAIGDLSQLCPAGIFTFNIWFKKNTGEWSTKPWETILGGPSGFELETRFRERSLSYIHPYSWGGGSPSAPNDYSIPYTLDEWHMLTMVRTSSYSKFYLDGELKVTGSAGYIPSGNYYLGSWKTATAQNYRGYLSDFRIYATELSESDILSLYQTSASIDNQQNFYSYEIEDNSTEYSGGLINSGEIFDLTFRATNNGLNVLKDVGIGLAHLQNVKGNTLAWNQLVNKNTSGGFQASGLTGSFNNGVWTYSGMPTSTAIAMLPRGSWGKVSAGHKYFLSAVGTTSSGNIRWVSYGGTNEILNKAVGIKRFDNNSNDLEPVIANLTIGTAFSASLSYLVIDLTLIYGAGNEPTSVEQFEADYEHWFGKPLTYEPYNSGELIPTKTTALKTTGFNQWDEEWLNGNVNGQGEVITGTGHAITKNAIRVFPSTAYHWHESEHPSNAGYIVGYDSTGNYLGTIINPKSLETDFTTPANCYHIRVQYNSAYSTINQKRFTLNLSHSGTRNGEYEPYEEHTLQLPLTTLTGKLNGTGESVVVFPDGMKKAGSIQDEIYVSGGKTYAVKRIGSVDLGNLNWRRIDVGSNWCFWAAWGSIQSGTASKNYTNTKYIIGDVGASTISANGTDKTLRSYSDGIYIKDSSYTNAATFKAAMQGVMLYYELAEPQVYELDDFKLPQRFKVNDYGTEEQISNTTSIPAELLISYDIKDKISLIGNETIYGDMIPIESGTYNYSYKYEVVGSNNLFLIGLEYYDTNRNLLSTANQVSSTGALSEKVTSGNVSIPANTKYVRYKIVNDANNNSTSNTSTIYFISLRLDTANPLLIYSTGESICNEFIELDQTSIHDSGITETNNIYEI